MLEYALVLFISDLVEIIHVELADKGGEVAVPEVDGKYLFLEAIDIKDCKVGSFLVPGDDL